MAARSPVSAGPERAIPPNEPRAFFPWADLLRRGGRANGVSALSVRKPGRYSLAVIGVLRSNLTRRDDAPNFYTEGAPDAFLEIRPRYRRGIARVTVGDELIVITWLHRARRSRLRTRPEDDRNRPLTGVFLTRSPDRPNPLGLHRCRVRAIAPTGLRIGPIEAIDGTPVVDIKPVVPEADDS